MSHQSPLIETDIHAYLKQHEHKDLLRFITCGSVDDGKSTLIGRLLHDAHLIYDDQLAALTHDSGRYGTTGDAPDLALLVDGLQSEREQGITIDVAYRYFSTEKRKFIIADTPGHEQYTRNMATGASTSSLAVVLIDARKGVLPQTKRHTSIVTLLGIRHLVVAVNKMDLVDYAQDRFEEIVREYREVLRKLDAQDVDLHVVPISALTGDNVVNPSAAMPWYDGPPLMRVLETIDLRQDQNFTDLRFPVQYVSRPDHAFRGYAGTIASGTLRVGDEVMVLPSRKRSRVKHIVTWDGDLRQAAAPRAVTVTLEDELDVTRGDMLVHPGNAPSVGDAFDATVVWMSEQPLEPGRLYDLKLGTKVTQGTVRRLAHKQNPNTLVREPADRLHLNEIGDCSFTLASPVAFDPYGTQPATGSFIVIDRVSDVTVGAGMIQRSARTTAPDRATNVTWHQTRIDKAARAAQKNQTPRVLWFTGLSGAGKSTIANALEQKLVAMGHHTYLLDGDNVRHGLNRDLGFGDDDRVENIRRIGEVAKLFTDAGLIVITAFISPFRSDRQLVRDMFEQGEFVEVLVDTPLELAEQRDPKGLYAKARTGQIQNFTGIDSPYERPQRPDVHLDTEGMTVEECVEALVRSLGVAN
ncbi:MAG: sulfate adenylyltransferase subunit CysN [Trueperaceae bacterium]|nr:sulfate adenylyltransferase subunit CysN [Trueperaceae bacterium]